MSTLPNSSTPRSHPSGRCTLVLVLLAFLTTPAVSAAPVPGFTEDWAGAGTNGWDGGGGGTSSNPGTGGVGGPADGYLRVTLPADGHFGIRSLGAEYAGDWVAAGIDRVTFWLSDIGGTGGFQIHFCIGNSINFWQYNPAFVPNPGGWAPFEVDVTPGAAASYTRIIGGGTFLDALQNVDRILIRHDRPPFQHVPDSWHGSLGIDHLSLVGVPTVTMRSSWGRLKDLYR